MNPYAMFAGRFTIEQSADAIVVLHPVMHVTQPGNIRRQETARDRYPFTEQPAEVRCMLTRTGWDGARLIIVRTYEPIHGCVNITRAKQTTEVLTIDKDGFLVVEQTVVIKDEWAERAWRPTDKPAPGENPPIVFTSKLKKVVEK